MKLLYTLDIDDLRAFWQHCIRTSVVGRHQRVIVVGSLAIIYLIAGCSSPLTLPAPLPSDVDVSVHRRSVWRTDRSAGLSAQWSMDLRGRNGRYTLSVQDHREWLQGKRRPVGREEAARFYETAIATLGRFAEHAAVSVSSTGFWDTVTVTLVCEEDEWSVSRRITDLADIPAGIHDVVALCEGYLDDARRPDTGWEF